MIKKCRVLINNEAVTVIDYDGIKVQIPSIKRTVDSVMIVKQNGKYNVVDDNYTETTKQTTKSKNKNSNKKTTANKDTDSKESAKSAVYTDEKA